MIQLKRQPSFDYSTNRIDPAYGFNSSQSWTVSAGTGSAVIDSTVRFEGTSSLKIENTDPTNDLTVTNASISTTINKDGNYNLSLYMLKQEADEAFTLDIQVFKNAVLLDTQTAVIGSKVSEDDVTNDWVRFQSDQSYSFVDTDVVTMTFTLIGLPGTALPLTRVFVDGIMISDADRLSSVTPIYTPPNKLPELPTADGNYQLTVASGVYSWTEIV